MLVIVAFMARLTYTTQQTHFQKQIVVIPEEDEWVEIVFFPLPMSCSIQFSVFRFKRFPLQRVRAGISAVANTHPPLGAFCTANPPTWSEER